RLRCLSRHDVDPPLPPAPHPRLRARPAGSRQGDPIRPHHRRLLHPDDAQAPGRKSGCPRGRRARRAPEHARRRGGRELTPMALDANGHPVSRIAQRKLDHLRLSLEASVQSTRGAGFERFAFTHQALPELDLDAIDTSTSFLGKPLKLPFLISSMTGGAQAAGDINRRLALVAQTVGIAFGVGSQRAGLTHKDLRPTYQVRSVAPDVLLFANLGAVQLNYGMRTSQALVLTHRAAPQLPLIASGGLHHGLDAAKAIGLGADLTGFAHAVLAAASEGEEPVRRLLDGFAWQLRVAMFCAGAPTIAALKTSPIAEIR